MKRKFSHQVIVKIKQLLSKGYSNRTVQELLEKQNKVSVSSSIISLIKNLDLYEDVERHLNDSIVKQIKTKIAEEEKNIIEGVKFSICEGYSHDEIMKAYKIQPRKFANIKKLKGVYRLIAPEYNQKLRDEFNLKPSINIDSKMVTAVKKLFVESNGTKTMVEISSIVGLHDSHVSRILSFKIYENYGQKFNSEIRKILKRKKIESENKKKVKAQKAKKLKEIRLLIDERNNINQKIHSIKNQTS